MYQQYPDALLRTVMDKLRADKMVSVKKNLNKNLVNRRSYVPLSNSPYQLSVTFSHKFLTRYQYDIYGEAWALAKRLAAGRARDEGTEVVIRHEGGFAAAVVGLMALDRLAFKTSVPEQLVVLDPNLSAVDHQYVRILQRYKELLRNSGVMDSDDLRVMEGGGKARDAGGATRKDSEPLTVRALFRKSTESNQGEKGESSEEPASKKQRDGGSGPSPTSGVVVARKSKPPERGERTSFETAFGNVPCLNMNGFIRQRNRNGTRVSKHPSEKVALPANTKSSALDGHA